MYREGGRAREGEREREAGEQRHAGENKTKTMPMAAGGDSDARKLAGPGQDFSVGVRFQFRAFGIHDFGIAERPGRIPRYIGLRRILRRYFTYGINVGSSGLDWCSGV